MRALGPFPQGHQVLYRWEMGPIQEMVKAVMVLAPLLASAACLVRSFTDRGDGLYAIAGGLFFVGFVWFVRTAYGDPRAR